VTEPPPRILAALVEGARMLDPQRRERGMVHGRRTSTPLSRRAPADLDAIVLTDRRTGVVAVLNRWAERIRREHRLALPLHAVVRHDGETWLVQDAPTLESESAVLAEHWSWASRQPWFQKMLDDLADLLDLMSHGQRRLHLIDCPVCGEPVDADTFGIDHRACISTVI
jgi:hypothetical protein